VHVHGDRGCLGRRGPRAGNRRNSGWAGGTRVGDGALVCGGWSWWWRWRWTMMVGADGEGGVHACVDPC
jgi:hypothetical protein